jgi:hypothetical protein
MNAMSISQLGVRLTISRASAYRLIAQRRIDVVDVGTGAKPRLRVTEAALVKFLARREIKGKAA